MLKNIDMDNYTAVTLLPWSGAEARARNIALRLGLVQERGSGLRSWLSLIKKLEYKSMVLATCI